MPSFDNVEDLAIFLTKADSVTGSPGEKAFPSVLFSLLAQLPYFKNSPEDLFLAPIPGDPKKRSNLFALARGAGRRCVILTGHYDVVQTSVYGVLEPWAFDPETLAAKMLESLERPNENDKPSARLKQDLASGEFLPGRGILDMKSGLAAGISALAAFSDSPLAERAGNILFLAVADEEGASQGMRAASAMLRGFLEERGLEAAALFNLDSAVDQGEGDLGRALFTGSVGKTLPFVFFVGKNTHVGAPYDGINPVLLASEFVREVESNPAVLGERQAAPGEEAPPPTVLYFRESRTSYDVTTPLAVFCALNALSHSRGPEDILGAVGKTAETAMDRAVSCLRERASAFSRRTSEHFNIPAARPVLVTFDEFVDGALRRSPDILEKARAAAALREPDDQVLQTLAILQELLPLSGLQGPAAVIGFAPPYYARAEMNSPRDRDFIGMLRAELAAFSKARGKSVRLRPFFPGISDMSFLAPSDTEEQRAFLRRHMPVADPCGEEASRISIGCPVLNLGPWGREYHQAGERVHREYAFVDLPELLARLIRSALDFEAQE